MENRAINGTTPSTVFSPVRDGVPARTREYLTEKEIERLIAAARAKSRWGHRDSTMILIG
jgi:hypothetical protein